MEKELPPKPEEQLLIDWLPHLAANRLICCSPGRAQFARAMAQQYPNCDVQCLYLDLYRWHLAQTTGQAHPPNLQLICASDFPEEACDAVALPCSKSGEAELTNDLLQSGYLRLREGGQLVATVDHPRDTWLEKQLKKLFRKVSAFPSELGVLYVGTKTEPLRRLRDFECEFAFRDQGRLLSVFGRPGVFSHRRLDVGARKLMDAMEIEPGARVLDLGCGSGAVAFAAAAREPTAEVWAVDSFTRAIDCVRKSAQHNQLANIQAELSFSGPTQAKDFSLVLANPPYYANFRIASSFLEISRAALTDEGELLLVTKMPNWYAEHAGNWFRQIEIQQTKRYFIITARGPLRS